MNTQTSSRRTLVQSHTEARTEIVNGIKTVDITNLPSIGCIACSWKGHTYELDRDDKQDSEGLATYSCPSCGNSRTLSDLSYEQGEDGNVYRVDETIEKAFEVPATSNKLFVGHFFTELKKLGIKYIEGAVVSDFTEPEQGSFAIKKSGEMRFEPPKDHIGIIPIPVQITLNDTQQSFILRFFVRSDVQILGED